MSEQRKLISVGDYLKVSDGIKDFELQDPDGNEGEMVTLSLRIRRANPRETIKIMEFVNNRLGDNLEGFGETKFESMTGEERSNAVNLSYEYDATLISSCVFRLPPEGMTIEDDTEPIKVWETADDVIDGCPLELYEKLKTVIGKQKLVMPEAEAKKS